jgi:hypothetical protein
MEYLTVYPAKQHESLTKDDAIDPSRRRGGESLLMSRGMWKPYREGPCEVAYAEITEC